MTSTSVLRYMERADRAIVLCHAIRHLLDHTNPFPREWMRGDMDAIELLQLAFDGPQVSEERVSPTTGSLTAEATGKPGTYAALQERGTGSSESRCEYPSPESTYGACDSLPCGRPADESGFCEKHRGLV